MNLAIVAHDFPPYNVGGSQRPYLMTKCFLEAGFDVTVFTLEKEHYPSEKLNYIINEDKIKIIRSGIEKKKDSILNTGHYFNLTDNIAKRWLTNLITTIKKLHQKSPFDFLLITCPPFSLASHAQKLSNKVGIPYILDFRDAWSQWILAPYPTYFHYRRLIQIEKRAIKKAVLVTSTSNQQIDDFINLHGDNLKSKFIYTPNGFQEYQDLSKLKSKTNKIKIVYTGSFYFNPYSQSLQSKKWYQKRWYQWLQYLPRIEDWSYRSPLYFFKTLSKLIKEKQHLSSRIEVVFAGQKPDWFDQMVKDYSLQENVKHIGFLNKIEVQSLLDEANYLLITSSKIPGGKEYSVAGKTFEYIAYQKPILAFVSEGEQKDVLKKTGLAYLFNPDNIEENVSKFKLILENNTSLEINQKACDQFKIPNNYTKLISNLKNL
ncbi:MAG: glycosyltransferase [Bacteroidota bacterium]